MTPEIKAVMAQKEKELAQLAPIGSFVRFNGLDNSGTYRCLADNTMRKLSKSGRPYKVMRHNWYGDELLINLQTTDNKDVPHTFDYWFPTTWLDLKSPTSDPPWALAIGAPLIAILGMTALKKSSKTTKVVKAVKVEKPEEHKLTK